MNYIDLRSDTFTVPTPPMLEAMCKAVVGDDVWGEDPTVIELQEFAAGLLGKEAALFVPSGTMANQIGVAINTKTGDEIIVDADAHIFYYEAGGPSIISRVQCRSIKTSDGIIPESSIIGAIRGLDVHFPRTSLICLENTHNRHGGTIIPLDYIQGIRKIADEHNIAMHCDGARLWNSCIAAGVSPAEYAAPFDTVSVCLSKGLGAPIGSLITGTKEKIASALRWRKVLGGGMRQVGIIAAAGLYALQNNYSLLVQDHENAKKFAEYIAESEFISIDLNNVQTNIVLFHIPETIGIDKFASVCLEKGLKIAGMGGSTVRAVFYYQIS
ncbi:MAG: Low-specificity L-threonine aldolase, partial [Bacteroidota bacterium]|nr:Low-specificity L-threonine aldolase [Bacteroidota bacterium]